MPELAIARDTVRLFSAGPDLHTGIGRGLRYQLSLRSLTAVLSLTESKSPAGLHVL